MTPRRPLLRYHGGKWRLAPWIIGNFPDHRCYVEPFGGAGSILIRKPRSYAEVYNDLDGEIVSFFRVLRDPAKAQALLTALELTPFARAEFEAAIDAKRINAVERARRTLVRSYMGFGSNGIQRGAGAGGTGFRSNATRRHTIPAHDWRSWPEHVPAFIERLRGVVIEKRPAVDLMRAHDDPKTLFYLDPPYQHGTRGQGNPYCKGHIYRHEMNDVDHRELAYFARKLVGMVVISGYASDLYDHELYPDWKRVERSACADGARARTEVLWINPAAQSVGQRQLVEATA